MTNLSVIILAGGLGKRMKSEIPKVLHMLKNKPMLVHVLETARKLQANKIYIVVGKYREIIEKTISKYTDLTNIIFVNQPEALGTGHAVQCVQSDLERHSENEKIVILSGDVPLLKSETISSLQTNKQVTLLTTIYDDPSGYGRIIQDENGHFIKIVEQKDCSEQEKQVQRINAGVYMFNAGLLKKYLSHLTNNNAQNEYYLTDIFEIIKTQENIQIGIVDLPKHRGIELVGVNTKEQLEELEAKLK
jgi:UDP-N-acetylglucosamine diphosphorylase/glucosamine-1-phosphate N-acetyltransferase